MIDDGLESVHKLWDLNIIEILLEQPRPDDTRATNSTWHCGITWWTVLGSDYHGKSIIRSCPYYYNMVLNKFKAQTAKLRKKPKPWDYYPAYRK